MHWRVLRFSSLLALATALASPLRGADSLELSNNYDALADVQPPVIWGIENPSVPAAPSPQIGPPPITENVDDTTRIESPPGVWVPGGYCGRGLEYSREFCRCASDWCPPRLDPSPIINLYAFEEFDTFRQIADGAQQQVGFAQGLNAGTPLPGLDQYGFGFQAGGSYGAYNLNGSDQRAVNTPNATQQAFITTGVFRRATGNLPISGGVVYDWMLSSNFGSFSQSPILGQGRAQMTYAFTSRNEVGIVGIWDCRDSSRYSNGPVFYSPVSQGNIFWNHRYGSRGAEGKFWAGITDTIRDNGQNSAGKMVFGLSFNIPVTSQWAFTMRGQSWDTTTAGASGRDVFDLSVGMAFYPSRTARSSTIAGRAFMPYLPVANNATFMTDINRVQ
ncbi:MAG TPA: DUF6666 family protein [Pirellulales bacterium]|jgi:hypothetical protein|nr:DUF6666 family protein [Pirellulales bacterium]